MSDVHTFTASGPADLLALVPGLLGFHPEDSVVLMSVGGGREPVHARIDLPSDPVAVEELVAVLAGMATRTDLRRFALLVYSDDAGLADAVLEPLRRRLADLGADLVCAARTHADRWWWIGAAADDPGTPHDVRSHRFMAEMVLAGRAVLGSRRELAASLVGTDAEDSSMVAALVAAASERLSPRADAAVIRRRLRAEGRWVRGRVRRFVRDGLRPDAGDAARLASALCASIEVRDVAWAELTRQDASRHVELWTDLVRRVPAEVAFAPATLLGFAAWLCGNGALAWCAVDVARESCEDYSLAGLLADVLELGMPPSAWRPIRAEELSLFHG